VGTEAISGVLLLHDPDGVVLLSVTVVPWHMLVEPVMAAGVAVTVTTLSVRQLLGILYVIVNVPVFRPVNTPVVTSIGATVLLLELHVPPSESLVSVMVVPLHMVEAPVIGAGIGSTFMVVVL
jgi:hypothetical protein